MTAIQNYWDRLQEIDNAEVKLSNEVVNAHVEYSNVGMGTGGSFEHTSELKPTKYSHVITGPDGEAWKDGIENEQNRMLKIMCLKL